VVSGFEDIQGGPEIRSLNPSSRLWLRRVSYPGRDRYLLHRQNQWRRNQSHAESV
jgi:hypothetical protein